MNFDDEQLDEILSRSLEFYEQGKPLAEIFAMYPERQKQLREFFDAIKWLQTGGQAIVPSQELLRGILNKLEIRNSSVANKEQASYAPVKAGKSPASLMIEKLTRQIQTLININWKIAAPAVAAVLVAIFLVSQSPKVPRFLGPPQQNPAGNGKIPQNNPPAGSNSPPGQKNPAPTDNTIDDAINAILSGSISEQSSIEEEEENNAALYNSESPEVNEFGQSYVENEF